MALSIAEINPKVEINSLEAAGPFGLPLLSVKFLEHMGQGAHTLAYKGPEGFIMCFDQQPESIRRWAAEHEPHDQFFLVANLKPGAKKRTKSDILSTDWLWVDIDPKEGEPNDGDERLKAFSPQPTIITNSGNGFHGFWKLDKPLDVAKDEGALLSSYLRELAAQLGGDMAVTDAPRMLRLPGSINHKKVDGKPSRKLTGIVREEGEGKIYSISAFARHTEEGEGPKEASKKKFSSLKKMAKVLNSIPLKESGDREIWRKLGTSLKSAYPGDDGFAVFNEWSFKDGKNYGGPAATRKEWDGFKEKNTDPNYLMSFSKKSRDGYEMQRGKILSQKISNIEKAITEIGLECQDNVWEKRTKVRGDTSKWLAPFDIKKWTNVDEKLCEEVAKEIDHRLNFDPFDSNVFRAVKRKSYESKYHPIKETIEKENWDKEERLDTWMIDYLHIEDNQVNRELSSIFIRSMVKRIYVPGVELETVPVFNGDQGCRKSSMLRAIIVGENFRNNYQYYCHNVKPGEKYDRDKKAIELTRGKWIVEIRELGGSISKDVEAIKDYFSTSVDEARMFQKEYAVPVPRQFVIVATTNKALCLNDPTGSRRFWPVDIPTGTFIDTEGIVKIRHQLFAEALVKIKQPLTMSPESLKDMEERGRGATQRMFLEEEIREAYEDVKGGFFITGADIRTRFAEDTKAASERRDLRETVNVIFPKMGYEFKRIPLEGSQRRIEAWQRPA